VILGKNTTEALNKLARRFPFSPGDTVLTSLMEHHSNDLPWRQVADVDFIDVKKDGSLDLESLESKLEEYGDRVKLVTITGASNVTGIVNPIRDVARLVHDAGAKLAVDAAQLAPHRAVDMGEPEDASHIDCLAYTGHKMYAPFGIGALVTLNDCLREDAPDLVGGGTVDFVTKRDIYWSDLPNREEAGTPNIVGAVAWAEAIRCLQEIGMDEIAAHESELLAYTLESLQSVPEIKVFGPAVASETRDRLGIVTFGVKDVHHKLVAAVLGYEGGIGVRSGMFCAHPYLLKLLQIPENEQSDIGSNLDRRISTLPGLTRVSFGVYNNKADIDLFVSALKSIVSGRIRGRYEQDPRSGEYSPRGFSWPTQGANSPRRQATQQVRGVERG
jgi:selenocysteine lyase/cysteine desulfurase